MVEKHVRAKICLRVQGMKFSSSCVADIAGGCKAFHDGHRNISLPSLLAICSYGLYVGVRHSYDNYLECQGARLVDLRTSRPFATAA